jgi:hypothetical protein
VLLQERRQPTMSTTQPWVTNMGLFRRGKKAVVEAKTCVACGESLQEHVQNDLASARIGSEDDHRLRQLIETGKWSEAQNYQAANVTEDIRVWRIIRCRDGRVGVVSLVMPIEMWRDDYYEEARFLSNDERDAVTAAVAQLVPQN